MMEIDKKSYPVTVVKVAAVQEEGKPSMFNAVDNIFCCHTYCTPIEKKKSPSEERIGHSQTYLSKL